MDEKEIAKIIAETFAKRDDVTAVNIFMAEKNVQITTADGTMYNISPTKTDRKITAKIIK